MPDVSPDGFAAAQIAGLKTLGWGEAALAREMALLRAAHTVRQWLSQLGEAAHERR